MKFKPTIQVHKYAKYYRDSLLIDTGPLLLYFLGEFDAKNGTGFVEELQNKSSYYTQLDYEFLKKFIQIIQFKRLLITPNIFHEFYKHVQMLLGDKKLYDFFQYNKPLLELLTEEHVPKNKLICHPYFEKLEIGELSLYMLKENEKFCAILTDDKRKTESLFNEENKKVLLILVEDAISHIINGPIPSCSILILLLKGEK